MRSWTNDWDLFVEREANLERQQKRMEGREGHGNQEGKAGQAAAGDDLRGQRLGQVDLGGILAQAAVCES